jgi:hypothetical protein
MYRKLFFFILLVVAFAAVYAEGSDALVVQTMLEKCGLTGITVDDVAEMEEGRVVKLNVSNRDVSKEGATSIPEEIGQLTALRELVCTDNSIELLPPQIGQCVNLQKIDMSSNRLAALPPEIGKLKNLVSLDVKHNSLETLPPELGNCVNLEYLWLWGNKLTDITPVVKLKKLRELYLKDNRLTTLPAGIVTMKFNYIDLLGNKLCNLKGRLDAWAKTVDKKYRSTQKCLME